MRSNLLDRSRAPRDARVSRSAAPSLRLTLLFLLLLAGNSPAARAQETGEAGPPRPVAVEAARAPQTYTREGVTVEFTVEPFAAAKGRPFELLSGTEATVRFRVFETAGRGPLSNLRPAAWIDRRADGHAPDERECRQRVQSFLQPDYGKRPALDLNAYFILSLNHEPNISVIDPLSGFGGSKLYTLVPLRATGEDWVMSGDRKRVYVSMPEAGRVAVVDTVAWKVVAEVEAGARPTSVALQGDGRYLWVGNDDAEGRGGVTVVDTETLKVAARLRTGGGHHELAFTEDDRLAFVTNGEDGTLTVIDVPRLARVADIKVGSRPAALAFSPLSRAAYVANEGDGTIIAVDSTRLEIVARMKAEPGLRAVRLLPGGRSGFAVNRVTNKVYVFDVSSNRLLHAVPVGPGADQINFTRQFAYVRSGGDEFVTMIKLPEPGKESQPVAVTRFPAGERAPRTSPASAFADAVVPAPEDGAVLVANPADKMIYYYTEGMAAPMGSFQNYRRDPKALLVLDKGLAETAPGVYTTTVRLAGPGRYDVAFLLDSPRMVNCFGLNVVENPDLPQRAGVPVKIHPLPAGAAARAGESYALRFRVDDAATGRPRADVADVGVLVFLAPGVWQQREWAKSLGEGVYEVSFVPPQSGVYYVHFHSPSLGVQLNHLPPLTVEVEPPR
jgi:YVTN family beta-propeller protein